MASAPKVAAVIVALVAVLALSVAQHPDGASCRDTCGNANCRPGLIGAVICMPRIIECETRCIIRCQASCDSSDASCRESCPAGDTASACQTSCAAERGACLGNCIDPTIPSRP